MFNVVVELIDVRVAEKRARVTNPSAIPDIRHGFIYFGKVILKSVRVLALPLNV